MLNGPRPVTTLPQTLYSVAAHTGIVLDPERLHGVLFDAREHPGARGTEAVTLELRIDVTSRERMREAAAKVREVADLVESGSAARDAIRDCEGRVFTRVVGWPLAFLLFTITMILLLTLPVIWMCSIVRKVVRQRVATRARSRRSL
jgi:hypothetical protein